MTQDSALEVLKTGASVFLTGQAGSGKTYVLNQYIDFLKRCGVSAAVTASTGIASTHLGGVTIHAWAGIGIKDSLQEKDLDEIESKKHVYTRIKNTKVLIIDEVSMLHAHRLDMVNQVLQYIHQNEAPFGGIQVVFCGDFFQLPPVTKSEDVDEKHFLFNADSFQKLNPLVCYLTEQYRQSESILTTILNDIREDTLNEESFKHLESRIGVTHTIPHTKLYTHNIDVDQINLNELAKIPGEIYTYQMTGSGKDGLIQSLKKSCLAPEILEIKKNARVMFVKNDMEGKFVNGTLGIVEDFDKTGFPVVRTNDGNQVIVEEAFWGVEDNGKILASISQLPLRLAWAMTIHKSQGMSLDNALVDLRNVFTYGQGYVALSRLKTIEGLSIIGIGDDAFRIHPSVRSYDKKLKVDSESVEYAFHEMDKDILQDNQKKFIKNIGGVWVDNKDNINNIQETRYVKKDTLIQTKELLELFKTPQEIAEYRKLTLDTIIGHLEKLKKKKQLPSIDHVYLDNKRKKDILSIFKELKTESLTLVMQKLQEQNFQVTYEELKVIRLFL